MVRRTAALAAAWACVGFCHGALNTDRVSLAGLSVNLADSAFMEGCAAAVFPDGGNSHERSVAPVT